MAEVMDPNVSVEEEPLTQVPESDQSDDEPQEEPDVVTVEVADDESVTPGSVPLVNGQTGEDNPQPSSELTSSEAYSPKPYPPFLSLKRQTAPVPQDIFSLRFP